MPYDKKLHMLCGFLIVIIGSFFHSALFGFLLCVAAGIAKECYDDIIYNGFDWKDAIATLCGGLIAVALLEVIK